MDRLAHTRRRVRAIRRTVATLAVILFVALFAVIYVQMGKTTTSVAAAPKATTVTTTSSSSSTTTTNSSSSSDSSSSPSPVQSSQS